MNLLIGLLPALFWGILPLCVARIGGRPTQQIMGTTLGTLAVAVLFWFIMQPEINGRTALMGFLSGAFWAFGQMNQYRAYTQIGVSQALPISTGMQLVGTSLMGMATAAVVLSLLARDGSRPWDKKSLQNLVGGVVFSFAALTYLMSIEPARNGVATGFTLSQMNVVIATLGSIFLLGEKKTRKEMRFVLAGLAMVVVGGVMIGLNG